jgi:sugar O-acyltransferase (sialic acid O-acetyltransferase NeuD family)
MQEEMHSLHQGYAVIATDYDLPQMIKDYQYAFISVGQINSPKRRIHLYERLLELGFILPTIIAPTAHVSHHATVGAGTIVMHGAIVNASARVGNNCIINTRALIEHDSIVADHCHVSTGALLNGSVRIGEGSFIGSGCVIRDGISLGRNCIVGMGVSVRHNQPNDTKFTGHRIS